MEREGGSRKKQNHLQGGIKGKKEKLNKETKRGGEKRGKEGKGRQVKTIYRH